MFFDATEKQDTSVVKTVEKLFSLTTPTDASLTAKKASPPWVIFRWGSLTGFLAYVSQVQAKYTLFTADGLPIRAACQVTLEELAGDAAKQNPTSGGLVPHRVHQVVQGDSLPAIAYREYGQPAMWRTVADLNRVDDPMRLRPGDRLLLPPLEELVALAKTAEGPAIAARRTGCSMAHGEEFSNTLLVKVDGTPLPDDIKPLLVNGYVDDSTNVPDMFVLRFSDDGGTVLAKARFKIGATVELSLQSTAPGGHPCSSRAR